MAARPPAGTQPKTLTSTGPILIVILVIVAALLGYYQIVYYPSSHTATSSSSELIPSTPKNSTIYIPVGAQSKPTPESFSPDHIVVYSGYNSTVFWVNNDTVEHTITSAGNSPDPRFDAFGPNNPQQYNIIQAKGTPGDVLNFTFTTPGNYSFFCSFHPTMKGYVIVKAAPPSLGSSTAEIKPSLGALSLASAYAMLVATEAAFAKSFATLTGSGTEPWSVNLSSSLFASLSTIPALLTKIP